MYLGLGFGLGIAACAFWPVRLLAEAIAVGSAVCFCGAALALPGLIKERFYRSRYDIRDLIEMQDREELKQIELNEDLDFDSVHCLNCGEVYSIRMPICPKCGAPPGSRCCS
jgi:hypothetical protein